MMWVIAAAGVLWLTGLVVLGLWLGPEISRHGRTRDRAWDERRER